MAGLDNYGTVGGGGAGTRQEGGGGLEEDAGAGTGDRHERIEFSEKTQNPKIK